MSGSVGGGAKPPPVDLAAVRRRWAAESIGFRTTSPFGRRRGRLNRSEIGVPHFFPFERNGSVEIVLLEEGENLAGGHFAGAG